MSHRSTPAFSRATADIEPPIPMLLFCPRCGLQHVDEPDPESGWDNPPHKSHLCHGCGCVWRPTDVPTTGVAKIETRGASDTWTAAPVWRCVHCKLVVASVREPDRCAECRCATFARIEGA